MNPAATRLNLREPLVDEVPERRNGAQAVERALRLLQHLAAHDGAGRRLTDLAAENALDAATARRLLATLGRYGFVEQDPFSRRYYLGLEFFTLAAAASNRRNVGTTARAVVARLAAGTRADAAFFLRAGQELVCMDYAPGTGGSTGEGFEIGLRRSIGQGGFGLAVLAAMPDAEAEDIALATVIRAAIAPEAAARQLFRDLSRAREQGFVSARNPMSGCIELAVAVLGRDGRVEGALGLGLPDGGADCDLPPLIDLLAAQAQVLEQMVRQFGRGSISYCGTRRQT